MAKETKTLSVNPSEEQSTVEFWQDFGWELVSSQEIFNEYQKTSVDYQGNRTLSTERTNYVKLVFNRDTTIENHDKIVALEKKLPPLPQKSKQMLVWTILLASIFAMLMGTIFVSALGQETYYNAWTGLYSTEYTPFYGMGIAFEVIGVIGSVVSVVLHFIYKKKYESALSVVLAQRNAIRLQAKEFIK